MARKLTLFELAERDLGDFQGTITREMIAGRIYANACERWDDIQRRLEEGDESASIDRLELLGEMKKYGMIQSDDFRTIYEIPEKNFCLRQQMEERKKNKIAPATAAAVSGAIENLQPVEPDPPPKKRAGRPKKIEGDGRVFSLWLPDETISELKKYAKKYGLTVSDLVRIFLSGGLESCHAKEKKETAAADPVQIPKPNISTVRHF